MSQLPSLFIYVHPIQFQIGIWNDLEIYMINKIKFPAYFQGGTYSSLCP